MDIGGPDLRPTEATFTCKYDERTRSFQRDPTANAKTLKDFACEVVGKQGPSILPGPGTQDYRRQGGKVRVYYMQHNPGTGPSPPSPNQNGRSRSLSRFLDLGSW